MRRALVATLLIASPGPTTGPATAAELPGPAARAGGLWPPTAGELVAEGDRAAADGRWDDAWRAYARATRRDPGDPAARGRRAELERQLFARGDLAGSFPYGAPGARGPGVPRWELFLLLAHLAALGVVLLAAARYGSARAAQAALVSVLLLVPWGEGGRLSGPTLGRALLLAAAAASAFLASRQARGTDTPAAALPRALWLAAALFLGAAALAAACSPDLAAARDGLSYRAWLVAALLASAAMAALDPRWTGRAVTAFALSAAGPAALLLAQRLGGACGVDLAAAGPPLALARDGRAAADFFHPGHLGTYLVAAGIAWLAPIFVGSAPPRRLVAGGLFLALGLGQGARASLLALVAGVAAVSWFAAGRRARRIAAGLVTLGAALGLVALALRFRHADPYAWTRLEIWHTSLDALATRPGLGFGPGAFSTFAERFQFPDPDPGAIGRYGRSILGPHSDLLALLLDVGLLGAVPALAACGLAGLVAWRSAAASGPGRPSALAALGAVAALLAHGLVDDFIWPRPAAGMAAAILFGALLGTGRTADAPRPRSRGAGAALVAALSVLVLAGDGLPWLADTLLRSGRPAAAARVDPLGAGYWIALGRTAEGPPPDRLAAAFDGAARAVELLPESPRSWIELARVHEGALRGVLRGADTYSAAAAAFRRALELHPHDVVTRRALGRLLAARQDATAAEREFRRAVADEPNYLGARLDLARVLRGRQDPGAEAELAEVRARAQEFQGRVVPGSYAALLVQLSPEERRWAGL